MRIALFKRFFWRMWVVVSVAAFLQGCLYVNVTAPLDKDLDKTTLGSKVGEASAESWFWAIATGDAGTRAAAENGGISVIHHADRRYYTVLFGLYARETTILYGD